jgi:hypothetical protein
MNDWADDEMGESEMDEADEEGEFEQNSDMADEEGEEDWVDDDEESVEDEDGEKVPRLVPAKLEGVNNERDEDKEVSISDINVDSSSSYDSDILDPNSTVNPHGFMFSNMLDTYSKTKKERIEDLREQKLTGYDEHRDRFKHKSNKGGGNGMTNKVKAKNKPMMMVRKKKIMKQHDSLRSANTRKKGSDRKRQLGHFRKSTK